MTATAEMFTVPVLWMDDEPKAIEDYKELLVEEGSTLRFDIVTTIDEARRKLQRDHYGAVVIDCKMERHGRGGENGAKFLVDLNRRDRSLPTFVFSGYADDPQYARYLRKANPIAIASKNRSFSLPLTKNPFFNEIARAAEAYLRISQHRPELVSFKDYVSHPDRYEVELESHWARNGSWISKEMEKYGYLWAVSCGDKLVAGSTDLSEFPNDEELSALGKRHNLIPFAYTAALIPEETGPHSRAQPFQRVVNLAGIGSSSVLRWIPTKHDGDWYPTVSVQLGENAVLADFDTGARISVFPEELAGRRLYKAWRSDHHLGEEFTYYARQIDVMLTGNGGIPRSAPLTVWFVRDWKKSPFIRINSGREALVGRDLLRQFDVVVCLCFRDRVTEVHFEEEILRHQPGADGGSTRADE